MIFVSSEIFFFIITYVAACNITNIARRIIRNPCNNMNMDDQWSNLFIDTHNTMLSDS